MSRAWWLNPKYLLSISWVPGGLWQDGESVGKNLRNGKKANGKCEGVNIDDPQNQKEARKKYSLKGTVKTNSRQAKFRLYGR